jgi:hypothetical protein
MRYLILIFCFFSALTYGSFLPQAPAKVYMEIATEHDIDPSLLYAIALAESGYSVGNKFQPNPFAIAIGYDPDAQHYQHQSVYPKTLSQAKVVLGDLITAGYTNLGIGLMQINYGANKRIIDDPLMLLNPTYNLQVASKVIQYCKRFGEGVAILSCYRTGNPKSDKGLRYAVKVIALQAEHADLFTTRYLPQGRMSLEQLIEYQQHRVAITH